MFPTAHHWPLSRAILIYPISLRSVLIAATNLRICLLSDLPSGPLTKPLKKLTLISLTSILQKLWWSPFPSGCDSLSTVLFSTRINSYMSDAYMKPTTCSIKDFPADEFQDSILSCRLYHVYFLTSYSFFVHFYLYITLHCLCQKRVCMY